MSQTQALPPEVYARVFENHAEGRQILEELTRRFARPAVTAGGIDAVLQTYQRDGSRRVIEFIVARINQAAGLDINQEIAE
jgi:hypothetical protein